MPAFSSTPLVPDCQLDVLFRGCHGMGKACRCSCHSNRLSYMSYCPCECGRKCPNPKTQQEISDDEGNDLQSENLSWRDEDDS